MDNLFLLVTLGAVISTLIIFLIPYWARDKSSQFKILLIVLIITLIQIYDVFSLILNRNIYVFTYLIAMVGGYGTVLNIIKKEFKNEKNN